jgi:crossover junction endodeoxyribonuclease RuvC
MRVLGLDPGLRRTGWGAVDLDGTRLSHVGNGAVESDERLSLAERLVQIRRGLAEVVARLAPHEAAVEETFVNKNPTTTLKLGHVRGIVLLVPAEAGLPVTEYTPNHVKKSVVGVGHAEKQQIHLMVRTLLPGVVIGGVDEADALAVAICHAHHCSTRQRTALLARVGATR